MNIRLVLIVHQQACLMQCMDCLEDEWFLPYFTSLAMVGGSRVIYGKSSDIRAAYISEVHILRQEKTRST